MAITVDREVFAGTRPGRTGWIGYKSLLYQYRRAVHAVRADDRLTAEAKAADVEKLKAEAKAALGTLNGIVEADINDSRGDAEQRLQKPAPDAVALLLEDRVVRRMERLLSAGQDVTRLATGYAEAGDLASLRVLRDEAPSLLAASGTDTRGVADILAGIDALTRPLLPASERRALDDIDSVNVSANAYRMNSNMVAAEIESAEPSCTVLVDGAERRGSINIGNGWEMPATVRG